MNDAPPFDKPALRHWALQKRLALSPLADLSATLTARLAALPEFEGARNVLLYLAMPGEVNIEGTFPLPEAAGKVWYVPRCAAPNRRLAIHRYEPAQTPLRAGPFGIREPDPKRVPETDPTLLDLVVVPALLLSVRGERLGYGGGYYDRFLPRLRPDCVRVGLLPDALVLPALPHDEWDQMLEIVVTERTVYRPAV